jgi:hypothetical protein
MIGVLMECPSPDHSAVAVLWYHAGGGAAGRSEQLVSIQPSDVPAERTPDRHAFDEAPLLTQHRGQSYELKWDTNDHLSITIGVSDYTWAHILRHSQVINGRRIGVMYHELEIKGDARDEYSIPPRTCLSGSQRIDNPPEKRLR